MKRSRALLGSRLRCGRQSDAFKIQTSARLQPRSHYRRKSRMNPIGSIEYPRVTRVFSGSESAHYCVDYRRCRHQQEFRDSPSVGVGENPSASFNRAAITPGRRECAGVKELHAGEKISARL